MGDFVLGGVLLFFLIHTHLSHTFSMGVTIPATFESVMQKVIQGWGGGVVRNSDGSIWRE